MPLFTEQDKSNLSKKELVEKYYLDENGYSEFIIRYNLELPLYWSSGDSVFRGDGDLCKQYKIFRFTKNLNFSNKSHYWDLSENDIELITNHHNLLNFDSARTNTVLYIRSYGKLENPQNEHPPRQDIRDEICRRCCANCGTNSNIEVDHKNSLKNDPRVLNTHTQTIDDFQALCRHCNIVKREKEKRAKLQGRRYGARNELRYGIDFTQGDFTLDINDPNWYIGTYWGDCIAFKQNIQNMNNNINEDPNINIIAQVEVLTNNLSNTLNITI